MVVDNGNIEMIFCEEGKEDNFAGDPFDISDATSMLNYLTSIKDVRRDAIADAKKQAEELAEQNSNDTEDSISE